MNNLFYKIFKGINAPPIPLAGKNQDSAMALLKNNYCVVKAVL